MEQVFFYGVKNNVGKGENDGFKHFLPFPTISSTGFFPNIENFRDCSVKSKTSNKQSCVVTSIAKKLLGEKNCGCKHFLLFQQLFLFFPGQIPSSKSHSIHYLFTERQNFRLVQIQNICRRQNKCWSKIMKAVYGRVESIVGKGENAGYQHFLFFPQCFHASFLLGGC